MNTNTRSHYLRALPLCTAGTQSFRQSKNRFHRFCLVFTFLLFLLPISAIAQDTVTGAFQGDISSNRTGDPIAGVVVRITGVQTGVVYNLTTDSKGRFYQGLLSPGLYDISITVSGFAPRLLRREIKVSFTGQVVPVPVSLEPVDPALSATQAVLESSDDIRVEINTTDARSDGSTKKDQITQLPLGANTVTRSIDVLALLVTGVVPPPQPIGDVAGPGVGPGVGSAGQFSVNGLRSRANNFTVDGSDNNDEDIGVRRQGFVALTSQPIESIQEFQVITLLSPAQFGRNLGAQVNVVSRQGANQVNGAVYGFFNSSGLNARNHFDSKNGNAVTPLTSATGQPVLLDGQQMTVRNQSGGKDPFTALQGGAVLGGAIIKNKLFYFVSGEYQRINASKEKNFVVPTVEERGPFGTGASGVYRNPFTGFPVNVIPNTLNSSAVFSMFPFPNNPTGVYGANTFTQMLPSSGKGAILSGRLDNNFKLWGRQQTFTARYNFTDDKQNIPAVGEAIFATVLSKIQTHNLSLFLNSQVNGPDSSRQISNQVRFSIGQSGLKFDEVRDTEFMTPSSHPGIPFLLNAPLRFNNTLPQGTGVPNTGPVLLGSVVGNRRTIEEAFYAATCRPLLSIVNRNEPEGCHPIFRNGAMGQVIILGFSPLGTDVNNFPQARVNKTLQIADELSWRLKNHTLVFGGDVRHTSLDSDLPRQSRPLLVFNGGPRIIPIPTGMLFRFPTPQDPHPILLPVDMAGLDGASNLLLNFNVDRPDAKADLRYSQFNFYGQDAWRVRNNLSISFGLRYEYNSPVQEVNDLIEKTFVDPRLSNLPGLRYFLDGRTTLYDADRNNFAPRIGIAYSPQIFGNGRLSVLRAGYGTYYDQILGAVVNQSRNVYPSFITIDYSTGQLYYVTDLPLFLYFNPIGFDDPRYVRGRCFPDTFPCPFAVLPGTLNVLNPSVDNSSIVPGFVFESINVTLPAKHLVMPAAHHYSFVYEQQLNRNLTLSVGYAGTAGRNLLRFSTPNLGTNTTPAAVGFNFGGGVYGRYLRPHRPRSDVGTVYLFETTASSYYNSLQTQLRGRLTRSFNFQFSYTFSKVTDDVSDVFDVAGAYALAQDSLDLKAESGPANFDVRHRWTYQFVYDVPKVQSNSILRALTNNLQIAGIGMFHSGQPFTVNSTIDINLDGNVTDRLDNLQGIEVTGNRDQPIRLTTDNFLSLLAPFGQNGRIGRNSFRAGSVLELDLSVIKRFSIGGRQLNFRTDIFNFINRANFGIPVRLLEAPSFGKATGTVTPGRRIQVALKYEF